MTPKRLMPQNEDPPARKAKAALSKPQPLKWANLKPHLEELDQPALLSLIKRLYDTQDLNRIALATLYEPAAPLASREFDVLKKQVYKLLTPKARRATPNLRMAKSLITTYAQTGDDLGTQALRLTYVEGGFAFGDLRYGVTSAVCASIYLMWNEITEAAQADPVSTKRYFKANLLNLPGLLTTSYMAFEFRVLVEECNELCLTLFEEAPIRPPDESPFYEEIGESLGAILERLAEAKARQNV